MAYSSCLGSSLESADSIVCGIYFACRIAEISSAQSLYCTYQACNSAAVRKVENIYIFDTQGELTIRSGSVSSFCISETLETLGSFQCFHGIFGGMYRKFPWKASFNS